MATSEQQISPEEKLLKVIQGGGKAGAEPVAAEPSAVAKPSLNAPKVASSVVPAATPPPAEKPKLKVVKSDPAPVPPATPAVEVKPQAARKPVAVQGRKRSLGSFSIGKVNMGLAAVIIILLGLTVVDIIASVTAKSAFERGFGAVAHDKSTGGAQPVVDASEIAKAFEKKPVFIDVGAPEQGATSNVVVMAPVVMDLQKTVKVIGFSGSGGAREVILVDGKDGRMYFAKSGQKFSIGDQQLELIEIQSDRVIVILGGEKVILTPGIVTPALHGNTGERKK